MSVLKNKLKDKFVTVPQEMIMSKELSFGAKVLYCYLVSKPNDWVIRNSELMGALNISKDTIAKYFKELVSTGWIDRKRQVDSQNQFTGLYDYVIYETPKVSEIGKMPKSEDFRNRKNAEENTKIIQPSNNITPGNNINTKKDNKYNINNNNINNNYFVDDNINNNYQVNITKEDKEIYKAFKEKLEEKEKKGIDIPKTENNAKKSQESGLKTKVAENSQPKTKKKFQKPTVEEIQAYIKEANLTKVDANAFFDHFESNGWLISGKAPMKDWKAAVRTWNRRSDRFNNNQNNNKNKNVFLEEYKRLEEEERQAKEEKPFF